jgi:hypothetical protein
MGMFGHNAFGHSQIKNLTAAFGALFNNLEVIRTKGAKTQTVKVPLTYASRDKAFERRTQDADLNSATKTTWPRAAFLFTGLEYDPSRKLAQNQYLAKATAGTALKAYQPAPWNLNYELYLGASSIEDGLYMIEQIVPFFNPEYSLITRDLVQLDVERNTPIVLNGVSYQDNTPDSDFGESRIIEWTLNFTIKSFIYGPVDSASKLIKHVDAPVWQFDENMNWTPSVKVGSTNEAIVEADVVPGTATPDQAHTTPTTVTEIFTS